jgi:arylsulfatase
LSCYGGEINTPHLDGLAKGGLRFTQFYNSARCCPTRAALLTGLYPHQAGVGMMTADAGEKFPGYRGTLQPHTVTLAEILKGAGYRTAMSGKWHVGDRLAPIERGFDDFYGFTRGYAVDSFHQLYGRATRQGAGRT